jgi:hypothetical protein
MNIYTKKTNRMNMPFFMSMGGLNVITPLQSTTKFIPTEKNMPVEQNIPIENKLDINRHINRNRNINPGYNFTSMFDRVTGTTCGSCPSNNR